MNARLAALALLTVVLTWSAQWHWTQTVDEPQHLWAGQRILQQADFARFDNSKMPVSVLNAAGWLWSQAPGVQGSWFWARAPQVVWLLGTLGLVFVWTRRKYGATPALAAAALVGLDPNLTAHAGLVTTDLPCTFGVLLACLMWSRFLEQPTALRASTAGAAVGFAQLTKFTAVFLGPILAIMTLGWCLIRRSPSPLKHLPTSIFSGLLVLNIGYGFSGTLTPASSIQWKSKTFEVMRTVNVPLPVPKPWIEGVDWVKHDDDAGQGRVYSHGERTHFGRPDHYLKTLPRKLPLPLMVLSVLGLAQIIRRREEPGSTLDELVPPIFLLLWFSLAFNSQVGSRYVLPAIPFLAIWAARLPIRWLTMGVGWTLVSALSWWPWGLSYFNETVLDRSQAWRIVADADLDWGQTDDVAKAWLEEHPNGLVNPDVPAPGPVLLSANRLTGVLGTPARMACYRDHFPPTTHLAGALYPLDVDTSDFKSCFPTVHIRDGSGPYSPGEHLLIARFTGTGVLEVGSEQFSTSVSQEGLLGVVITADTPFSAQWTLPPRSSVYLNGQLIEGRPGNKD